MSQPAEPLVLVTVNPGRIPLGEPLGDGEDVGVRNVAVLVALQLRVLFEHAAPLSC
jgi:hypothetical protein